MELRPATPSTTPKPTYPPSRRRRSFPWRLAAAAAASLWIGCSGLSIFDDTDHRMAGVMVANSFVCSDTEPDHPYEGQSAYQSVPGLLNGELCGDQTAWYSFELEEATALRFEVSHGADAAVLSIATADGEELAELSEGHESAELTLPAGRYVISATGTDPDSSHALFELGAGLID